MKINKNIVVLQALHYLGGGGQPEDALLSDVERAAQLLLDTVSPCFVTKYSSIEITECVRLTDLGFELAGSDIREHLKGCGGCLLLCATLGMAADSLISQWSYRDKGFSLIINACADAAIEYFCNAIEANIADDCSVSGQYITDRFSPGYGDLPLETQIPLCAALGTAKAVGVTLNQSCLMTPQKSVTAIIGISDEPREHRAKGCSECSHREGCELKEKGGACDA